MKIIKNGTLTKQGNLIYCLNCSTEEGHVLAPADSLDIYYCLPCIQQEFKKHEPK